MREEATGKHRHSGWQRIGNLCLKLLYQWRIQGLGMLKRIIIIGLAMGLLWRLDVPRPAAAEDCLSQMETESCLYGLPRAVYLRLLPQIEASPTPTVKPIRADEGELARYALYKLNSQNVTFYDRPNGVPIGTENPGFSFLMPRSQTDGWMEVKPGRWVPLTSVAPTRPSNFGGVEIDSALPFPLAWMLRSIKPSALPGKPEYSAYAYLLKFTRVYIYATRRIGNWDWYLVGPGKWIDQRYIGKITPGPQQNSGRWLSFDLYEQVLVAHEGDRVVFATLGSSGLEVWPTRLGTFAVTAKSILDPMSSASGRPDAYNIPMVPYVMYFDEARGLHGTFWHNNFGYPASRGCINLSIADAKWLYSFVDVGTPVIVWRSR